MEVWRKATYLLMSNIGTVLSGRILLYRNHHPAESGAIRKNRLISAYVQAPGNQEEVAEGHEEWQIGIWGRRMNEGHTKQNPSSDPTTPNE
jgi:hypothetical protein